MRLQALLLFVMSCFAAGPAVAQSVDLNSNRVRMSTLTGPWRFHTGDDPAWANPGFDDSQWSLLYAGKSWSQQGYSGYAGVAWYRLSVTLPAHPGPLAIYLAGVDQSCQIFANGHLVGQIGSLPPQPRYVLQFRQLYPVPDDAISPGRPLELAIRVWLSSSAANAGGLISTPRIGDAATLDEWRQLQIHDTFWRMAAAVSDVSINIFTALAGIGLFLLRRREREYLWWGLSQAFWAAFVGIALASAFFPVGYASLVVADVLTMAIATWLQVVFYVVFLRQRWGWLFWSAALSVLLSTLFQLIYLLAVNPVPALIAATNLFSAFAQACIVAILWIGARRRDPDAPLLLIPNCIMLSAEVLRLLARAPLLVALPWAMWMRQFFSQSITWPFTVNTFQVIGDFEMLAVLVILVRRYARSRQDEERLESELEAARAVQKVLIPNDVPTIPGFAVETVYQPAAQVGGDFFQIIPLNAGGALIAIGDVSGKGMPAAMTVSLLVGTLRTLAYYTQSPGEILTAMNRRMLSRSHGGFTTCLVLRLDSGGTLTMANAGHIGPYLDGKEIDVESGLPLGLDGSAEYHETTFGLGNHAQLTLLTDGVVEARKPSGELLGFERTRELSTHPAREVAQAAQSFGQQDDITVLTLSVATAAVPA